MGKKIDTYLFIEAWEGERCLCDVNSDIYKNRYEKVKSFKKLAEQFDVTGKGSVHNWRLHCNNYSSSSSFFIKIHFENESTE